MDKFNINEALGEILKKYRLKRERPMSQIEFSELLGIDFTYYGRIERGEHSITIDTCLLYTSNGSFAITFLSGSNLFSNSAIDSSFT